jgi:hypothetical protein
MRFVALALGVTACATPRSGLDPAPFLASAPEARVLERAAISCMTDDRCTTHARIDAWKKLIDEHPKDGLRGAADLGLALAYIDADRLMDADEALASLRSHGVIPPLLSDGLTLALAALDNRRERAAFALVRLAPLEGRFIDEWLAVRFTRERVLAFKRSGRSEEALRSMSIWVSGLRDDSPQIAEARRLAEGFDDVAIETYLRVRSGRPTPEPLAPAWLTYLVDRTAMVVLRERRPRSAQWLLENPSLSSRLRSATIDALRLLAAELGRRGADARAHAIVVIPLRDDAVVRRALAFSDGLARLTAGAADKLVVETIFLDENDSLERRIGRGTGTDILIGAFSSSELPMLKAFAEPRSIPMLAAIDKPAGFEASTPVFFAGLVPRDATAALLAARPGPVGLACIGADCTDLEPLFQGREEAVARAKQIFVRGPVDLGAALAAAAAHPVILRLPDDLETPRERCFETISVEPIGAPNAGVHRDWWFDLGADVGTFLSVAVATTQASNPTMSARMQSTTIHARTAELGRFTSAGVLERRWAPHRHGCAPHE